MIVRKTISWLIVFLLASAPVFAHYANSTLYTYCDGYIFQGRLEDSEGVTVDPLSITEANLQEAIAYLPNPAFRKRIKKPDDLIAAMRRSADMKRRFKDLK